MSNYVYMKAIMDYWWQHDDYGGCVWLYTHGYYDDNLITMVNVCD